MSTTVLVTWATLYGSTEEVAHAIADDLLKQHFAVTAMPMSEVGILDRYQAVVMGFPLYMFRIHKHARSFLESHREELIRRPVALFALGPFHAEEKEFVEARKQLEKELAKYPWFSPVAQQVIGGRFDPQKLRFPYRFLPVLRNLPASDARDWDAIHAWAGNLPPALVHARTH
ncbi:MAG: flavodoxin domain-containing protein [Acidobacteriaceae bacterium]